jgi:uncharacterized membrane protein
VIRESELDAVLPALRQYRGDVLQSTLSTEVEDALRESLASPRV